MNDLNRLECIGRPSLSQELKQHQNSYAMEGVE